MITGEVRNFLYGAAAFSALALTGGTLSYEFGKNLRKPADSVPADQVVLTQNPRQAGDKDPLDVVWGAILAVASGVAVPVTVKLILDFPPLARRRDKANLLFMR